MQLIDIPGGQGSPQWHAFRRVHLCASDVRSVIGICPFKGTKLQVWDSKCLGRDRPFFSPAAERGQFLEPSARAWLEDKLGFEFPAACVESSSDPWAAASLDGINQEHRIVAEIKCGGKALHEKALKGEIPDYYLCQIDWQLFCTGYDKAIYVSFMGLDGVIVEVERNQSRIDKLVKECKKFWFEHVLEFECPKASDADWIEETSSEWLEYAELKKKTTEALRQARFQDEAVKAKLEELADGRVRIGSPGLLYFQTIQPGPIDYKAFLKSKGKDPKEAEKFRTAPIVKTNVRVS